MTTIGYFLHCSDRAAEKLLRELLWNRDGIEDALSGVAKNEYGDSVREVLVGIYAEGAISIDCPNGVRVLRLDKSDGSIRSEVGAKVACLLASRTEAAIETARCVFEACNALKSRNLGNFDATRFASDVRCALNRACN